MDQAGETQYSLSAKSGVPQPTIQRILSGQTASPKADTLRALAKWLRTPAPIPEGKVKADRSLDEILDDLVTILGKVDPSLHDLAAQMCQQYLSQPAARGILKPALKQLICSISGK